MAHVCPASRLGIALAAQSALLHWGALAPPTSHGTAQSAATVLVTAGLTSTSGQVRSGRAITIWGIITSRTRPSQPKRKTEAAKL